MKYDFKPGERIRLKGTDGPDLYFVAEIGGTVYATEEPPGFAVNAKAVTACEWERTFFVEDEQYKFSGGYSRIYTVHHLFVMAGKRYAGAVASDGKGYLLGADDFGNMLKVV